MNIETEQRLLVIWRAVLENNAIACSDAFLSVGGDSISAMLCISRIRESFGVQLNIVDFFVKDVTVKSLAAEIDALTRQ